MPEAGWAIAPVVLNGTKMMSPVLIHRISTLSGMIGRCFIFSLMKRIGKVILGAVTCIGVPRAGHYCSLCHRRPYVQCNGLDIVQYDAEKLQAELGDAFELVEESSELHITPANNEQKFSYFRFVKK